MTAPGFGAPGPLRDAVLAEMRALGDRYVVKEFSDARASDGVKTAAPRSRPYGCVSAARVALYAFERVGLRDDEALRKQGADLLSSILPSLRMAPDAVDDTSERLSLLDFVAKAASHLPTDYAASESYVDDAQARLDGALRSAAALDPAAFLEAIHTRTSSRTPTLSDPSTAMMGYRRILMMGGCTGIRLTRRRLRQPPVSGTFVVEGYYMCCSRCSLIFLRRP